MPQLHRCIRRLREQRESENPTVSPGAGLSITVTVVPLRVTSRRLTDASDEPFSARAGTVTPPSGAERPPRSAVSSVITGAAGAASLTGGCYGQFHDLKFVHVGVADSVESDEELAVAVGRELEIKRHRI